MRKVIMTVVSLLMVVMIFPCITQAISEDEISKRMINKRNMKTLDIFNRVVEKKRLAESEVIEMCGGNMSTISGGLNRAIDVFGGQDAIQMRYPGSTLGCSEGTGILKDYYFSNFEAFKMVFDYGAFKHEFSPQHNHFRVSSGENYIAFTINPMSAEIVRIHDANLPVLAETAEIMKINMRGVNFRSKEIIRLLDDFFRNAPRAYKSINDVITIFGFANSLVSREDFRRSVIPFMQRYFLEKSQKGEIR